MFLDDLSGLEFRHSVLALMLLLAGTALALFLAILFARKQPRQPGDVAASACIASICLWHLFAAAVVFGNATGSLETPSQLELWLPAACQGMALSLAFLVNLRWGGFHWAWSLPLLAGYLAGASGLLTVPSRNFSLTVLGLLVVLSGANAMRDRSWHPRRVHVVAMGASLAALAAVYSGRVLALETVTVVLLAGLAIAAFWKQALGLAVERRVITVMLMAVASVAYLIAVTVTASDVSLQGGLGDLTRLAMLCAAGLFWVPLYAAMARLLTRRTELCIRSIRQVMTGAERVLDLEDRCGFLCTHLRMQLDFRRCALAVELPRKLVLQEPAEPGTALPDLRTVTAIAREQKLEVIGTRQWRGLRASGFSCALPLWGKEALLGFLLVETGRKWTLEDLRPVFPMLAQELAQSISVCALVEEKLALERALVRREHLAGLGQLAASVAHEVKNPLSSIHAIAQIMSEDEAVMEQHSRDIEFIASETARLAGNVQQLLAYARPAASRSMEQTQVYALLEVLASTLKREQAQRGIDVIAYLDEQLRHWKAPGELLREVVLNLLLNAAEFSSPGMVVEISGVLVSPGECEIEVTDMGPGVPPEAREKIFEPFFSTRQRGAGLGLATVRKNLNEMGGSVELTSPVSAGQGSRFRVRFPVAALEVQPCTASA